MPRLFALLLALFVLSPLSLIPVALADAEHYENLSSAPADYRLSVASPLDGADSLDFSAPLKVTGNDKTVIETKGNPTLYVRVDTSVQGATVDVYAVGFVKIGNTYRSLGCLGKSTATGGDGTRATGRYVHNGLLLFDTACATHVELRKADPSSGNVSLTPWLGGYDPRGAE
jgi:hypothetical protein